MRCCAWLLFLGYGCGMGKDLTSALVLCTIDRSTVYVYRYLNKSKSTPTDPTCRAINTGHTHTTYGIPTHLPIAQ